MKKSLGKTAGMAPKAKAKKASATNANTTKAKTTKVKSPVESNTLAEAPAAVVEVGQGVPDLTLPSTGQKTVKLSALAGKVVVLYFYPKDATPGCTIEGHEFSDLKNDFDRASAVVFGISRDSVASHEKFKSKENYCIDLLSDEKEEASQLFGVIKMKNMYGKMVRGLERSTFVIGRDGKLLREWRGVKAEGHANAVLDYVRTLIS
jgi:thioredoxin-dependent peroxiredoxin